MFRLSLSLSQEALLELKTKNYSLEDQCRKQKSGKQLLKKAAKYFGRRILICRNRVNFQPWEKLKPR